jgi:hypothetical protein
MTPKIPDRAIPTVKAMAIIIIQVSAGNSRELRKLIMGMGHHTGEGGGGQLLR